MTRCYAWAGGWQNSTGTSPGKANLEICGGDCCVSSCSHHTTACRLAATGRGKRGLFGANHDLVYPSGLTLPSGATVGYMPMETDLLRLSGFVAKRSHDSFRDRLTFLRSLASVPVEMLESTSFREMDSFFFPSYSGATSFLSNQLPFRPARETPPPLS